MQEKQQQRLIPKFDDEENKKLNKSIKELSSEMTLELKDCQKILKEIINDEKTGKELKSFNSKMPPDKCHYLSIVLKTAKD